MRTLKIKALATTLLLLTIATVGLAQTKFERLLVKDTSLYLEQTVPIANGEYISVGQVVKHDLTTFNSLYQGLLLKLNANGDTLWTKSYGKPYYHVSFSAVASTYDDGIVFGGKSTNGASSSYGTPIVGKTNALGDTLWFKELPSLDPTFSQIGYVSNVAETADSNIVVVGYGRFMSQMNSSGTFLVKLNQQGDTLWTKEYYHPGYLSPSSLELTNDGGFLLSVYSASSGSMLLKLDALGNILWEHQYEVSNSSAFYSESVEVSGGYVQCRLYYFLNSFNVEMVKLDLLGNLVWVKSMEIPFFSNSFSLTSMAAGFAFSLDNSQDILLYTFDANGNNLEAKRYPNQMAPGSSDVLVYDIDEALDGGVVITGVLNTYTSFNEHYGYVLKTDSNLMISCPPVDLNPVVYPYILGAQSFTPTITSSGIAVQGFAPVEDFPNLISLPWCGQLPVWPGDINVDGTANNLDYLYLGLANTSTGPVRATQSIGWSALQAADWNNDFITAYNYKHADCNGNGLANAFDTTAIQANYDLTHFQGAPIYSGSGAMSPALFAVGPDSLQVSQVASVDIVMGTSTLPVSNLHGIAFTVSYDTSLVDSSDIQILFANSWLGTPGADVWTMARHKHSEGQIEFAFSRFDLIGQSGFGPIATLQIVMPDDISVTGGQVTRAADSLDLSDTLAIRFEEILAFSPQESLLDIEPLDKQIQIFDRSMSIDPNQLERSIATYPNPAQNTLHVFSNRYPIEQWQLRTVQGAIVKSEKTNKRKLSLSVAELSAGIYFLTIQTELGNVTRKIVVQR